MPDETPFVSIEKQTTQSFMESLGDLSPTPQPATPPDNGKTGPTGSPADGGTPPADGSTAGAPETKQEANPKAAPTTETPPAPETKPEAKAETKPAEVAKEEPATGEEKWPRSAQDWKNARAKAKEREDALKSEIEALKKQVTESTAKKAEPEKPSPEVELTKAELEKLRKENEEYSKRLQVLDVTKHPKFEQHFNNRVSQQVELAKRLVGSEKAGEIERILALPDGQYKNEQLDGFLAELSPVATSRLGGVLNNLEAIESEKREAIAQAQSEREKFQAEQTASLKKAKEQAEQTWKSVVAELQDPENGLAVYQVREGDTDWNNGIIDRVNLAKKLVFERNDPSSIAKHALQAVAFPTLLNDYKSYIEKTGKEIESLKKQVSDLTATQPSIKGAGKPTGQPEPVPIRRGNVDPRSLPSDYVRELRHAQETM